MKQAAGLPPAITPLQEDGTDLYNSGEGNGSHRLYCGVALTLTPFLDKHPELQQGDQGLA